MIFALALLMSTPIFFHTHLHIPEIAPEEGIEPASPQNFAVTDEDVADSPAIADFEQDEVEDYWSHLVFCIEDWNYGGRGKEHPFPKGILISSMQQRA